MSKRLLSVLLGLVAAVLYISYAELAPARTDSLAALYHVHSTPEVPAPAASSTVPLPQPPYYRVVRVIDGDTVVLAMAGTQQTVRLIGLDTPEVVDPRKPVQCYGKEASQEAHVLLDGHVVRLERDPTQSAYDKYGRLLAYLYLPDERNFEEVMIATGYGREYTYKVPYRYQAQFKADEARAQAQQLGLWSACAN